MCVCVWQLAGREHALHSLSPSLTTVSGRSPLVLFVCLCRPGLEPMTFRSHSSQVLCPTTRAFVLAFDKVCWPTLSSPRCSEFIIVVFSLVQKVRARAGALIILVVGVIFARWCRSGAYDYSLERSGS